METGREVYEHGVGVFSASSESLMLLQLIGGLDVLEIKQEGGLAL